MIYWRFNTYNSLEKILRFTIQLFTYGFDFKVYPPASTSFRNISWGGPIVVWIFESWLVERIYSWICWVIVFHLSLLGCRIWYTFAKRRNCSFDIHIIIQHLRSGVYISDHAFETINQSILTQDGINQTTKLPKSECNGTFTSDIQCIETGSRQSSELEGGDVVDDVGELFNTS